MNMKKAQITLKLFLDALGISPNISTLADRKKVQKAVYIGQKAGVDLGYSYGWYRLGPYSPELTKDYFALQSDLMAEDTDDQDYKLGSEALKTLTDIKYLLEVPINVDLSQDDWLELVASVIYKVTETGNVEQTEMSLNRGKPHLMHFFDDAIKYSKQY